jgi:hypothetical protein
VTLSVRDENIEDLSDRGFGHGRRGKTAIDDDSQWPALRGQWSVPAAFDVADDAVEVERGTIDVCIAREAEEVIDRCLESIDRFERSGECGADVGVWVKQCRLDVHPQPRDRGAKLMRRIGAEGALTGDKPTEALSSIVERETEMIEFGDTGSTGSSGEVAGTELLGGRHQRVDRPCEAASLPTGEQRRDKKGSGGDERHDEPRTMRPARDHAR